MSLRTFTDSAGQDWEAYDVVPRSDERRRYDRRSGEVKLDDAARERRDRDRRLTVGGAEHITSKAGWLCFESQDERRRLTPIPADWTRCDEAKLETYCRQARPARLTGEQRTIT